MPACDVLSVARNEDTSFSEDVLETVELVLRGLLISYDALMVDRTKLE